MTAPCSPHCHQPCQISHLSQLLNAHNWKGDASRRIGTTLLTFPISTSVHILDLVFSATKLPKLVASSNDR